MDLFIMDRFNTEDQIDKDDLKEKHLAHLLTKIEQRKRQREVKTNTVNSEDTGSQRDVSPSFSESTKVICKKRKKRKFDESNAKEKIDHHDHAIFEEHASLELSGNEGSVKMSKKSKKGNLHANETGNNDQDMWEESHLAESEDIKPKKKRKSKKRKELNVTTDSSSPLDFQSSMCTDKNSDVTGFTIIGTKYFQKKSEVTHVLPNWIANPIIIRGNLQALEMTIHDIPELDKDIIRKLEHNNITHFFPVQNHVIPWLLTAYRRPVQYRPCDVCVSAPTGSGKTLAFVLPIVQALKGRVMRHIRALVVLPVHDLAMQIFKVFNVYCEGTDLKVALLTGKSSFEKEQEILIKTSAVIGSYSAVDIVVATPGRLVDHILSTPGFSLSYLRFLVIDEADRIVDSMHSSNWLYHVEKHMSTYMSGNCTLLSVSSLKADVCPPQKLLFSATLSHDPEKLQQLKLFQPKLFTSVLNNKQDGDEEQGEFVGKYTTPAELTEQICITESEYKPLVLYHLMTSQSWTNVLCFTNSQCNTHRLTRLLTHMGKCLRESDEACTLRVEEISSCVHGRARDRIIRNFSAGKIDILVSSDALARGIDISNVKYVVSYDMPSYISTYIHRIGRTARAGRLGTAITMVTSKEVNRFRQMLQSAAKESLREIKVSEQELEYLEETYRSALESLKSELKKEEVETAKKRRNIKRFKLPKVKKVIYKRNQKKLLQKTK